MAQTYGIPVGNKNSRDQLKKTLTIDLDPELYNSWCHIGTNLNLTAHSKIVAFLINFYQERDNWTAREKCETCGAGLTLYCPHCLTQHSPQFVKSSKKPQKTHPQNQLRTKHLLDKCKGDRNHTDSKFIVETKQNPVKGMSPLEEDSDDSSYQDTSFDACTNIDSDGGNETFDSSSCPELLTTDGVIDETNDNTHDDYAVERLEPAPGKWISSDLGLMPKLQNCAERSVEGQQKLKPVKVESPVKRDAEVLPRIYKIIGLLKKSDKISALALEAADVKAPVNNFDDPLIQGQPNNLRKTIYLFEKNVAPVPKAHLQGQATNNNRDTDCTQGQTVPLPVTSMSHLEEDSDDSSFDSDGGEKTFDSSSFPELLMTDGVIDQINDNTLDYYPAGRLEPNPGKGIFFPVNSELGPMPKLQNCTEISVELRQQKLKPVKVASPEKSGAEVLPRSYKIIGLLKKSDTISAPSFGAADVKTPVNNVDYTPVQGQSNNTQKKICLLNRNVVAPVSKGRLQGQATVNVRDKDCTQGPTVTLIPIFKQEEGQVAAPPVLQATDSRDGNKIAHVQNPTTLMRLHKKIINAVPLPEVQSVNAIGSQVADTNITNSKLIHRMSVSRKNHASENGQLKDLCVGGAAEANNAEMFDPPRKKRRRYIPSSVKKMYVCPICDKIYTSAVGYKNHKDQHMGDLTRCSICNKKYSSLRNLKSHQKLMHQGLKPFKCDLCIKQFSHNNKLRDHMLIHGDATPYACPCGKAFKTSQHLKIHSKTVHTGRDHVCEVCGKAFKLLKILEGHRKHVHEGVQRRRHACELCGASFGDMRSLKLHRLRHTGEPRSEKKVSAEKTKVVCEICSKSFLPSVIKNHRRTHTGEKPYFCAICCKSFATQKHKRIHEVCKLW